MKRNILNWILSASLMAGSSCAFAANLPEFSRDIAPILNSRCASCHLTGQEDGNLALTKALSYDSIVNKPSIESDLLRVKPGEPEKSYLLLKLEGRHLDTGGSGARMPFGGAPLDAISISMIRTWIAEGAKP